MLVSFTLPDSVAQAVCLESARRGMTPGAWIVARLSDHFGCRPAAHASRVRLVTDDENDVDRTASDQEGQP